ncbi:MAG: protein-L-isoaspartate O-methyltransferase [Massilia sp.]|jgi:protein-L-isoaspartate(D-aspartate) O-methyltransferase|nr:protein-L-isoaspartate O-methyltransferase [Massilia sp.]
MKDRSGAPKNSNFPLPLSSLTRPAERKGAYAPAPVATPQTATRNAARTAVVAPYVPQRTSAAPSKSHSEAMQRAQPAAPSAPRADLMVSDAIRRQMVTRVAKQGVQDPLVLAALDKVPRHMFIEPALSAQAYIDASLPIGHHQTISQPYIVARMIEVMRNGGKLGRVLEIGTGCGYQAAVLACIAQEVYSIERIKPLHELAKSNLRPLRISNLRLQYGDGMLGLPQVAPFDGIILAAAGLEVPRALLEQLAIGGRLVAPVGAQVQHLQLITRSGKADWMSETLEGCHFVPLRPGTV